jgi:hypothetical protein
MWRRWKAGQSLHEIGRAWAGSIRFQRGSNENMNGLLRQYFPKRTDLSGYTQSQPGKVALRLNQRPRRISGFESSSWKPLLRDRTFGRVMALVRSVCTTCRGPKRRDGKLCVWTGRRYVDRGHHPGQMEIAAEIPAAYAVGRGRVVTIHNRAIVAQKFFLTISW